MRIFITEGIVPMTTAKFTFIVMGWRQKQKHQTDFLADTVLCPLTFYILTLLCREQNKMNKHENLTLAGC